MRPLTEKIPKALLPIQGVPFIEYQLKWWEFQGIRRIVLCVGYLGEQIKNYVEARNPSNLQVDFVFEGENLKGTGGAVRLALDTLSVPESFLLTYGDSFLPFSLSELLKKKTTSCFMSVFKNQGLWDTSNVKFSGDKILYYGKEPSSLSGLDYIDYGFLGLTRKEMEKRVASGEKKDLSVVLNSMVKEGILGGIEVPNRFFEIGSGPGLKEFDHWVGSHYPEVPGIFDPSILESLRGLR